MSLHYMNPDEEPRECQKCDGTGQDLGSFQDEHQPVTDADIECCDCDGTGQLGNPGAKSSGGTSAANAALIAAAPDLLAAAEAVLAFHEMKAGKRPYDTHDRLHYGKWEDYWEALRAAIAKARGEK
jgi:hypothetical protein